MRIAIGQLWQETNTFNPRPTTRRDFEEFGVLHGDDMLDKMADTNELGAFIQSLRRWPNDPEIVGLVRLPAWPSGVATRETFEWIRDEMVGSLQHAGKVDGVLLALHGAMVADGVPDVEGEILKAVRDVIGLDVPLVGTLDLHANVTQLMVDNADALVLFHTAPHIDVFETGQRGAEVLRRILLEGARPTMKMVKLSMVAPVECANTQDPDSVSFDHCNRLRELERLSGVLTVGLATVQPWLDIPELGTSVIVVTDDDESRSEELATKFASQVWESRDRYMPTLTEPADAVRAAFETPGLVVLSDPADATTSGAPGDSTHLLRELLKHDWRRQVLVPLVSPEIVDVAKSATVGETLNIEVGGKRDPFSEPLLLEVQKVREFAGQFVISGHLAKNLAIDMGDCVVLSHGQIQLLVTSRSGAHFAPEFFRTGGFDPFADGVVVAKSPCGFRAAYAPLATLIHVVRAPGCARPDFWNLPYHAIPRPMWPWETECEME